MKKMMFSLMTLFIALATQAQTAKTWQVDPVHSAVKFSVSHLVISEVDGSFKKFQGSIKSAQADLQDAQIEFNIDVNSINTDNNMRDEHLKSADFFDAKQFPSMKFVSTSFKKKSGNNYILTGNMTIKGVTKKVSYNVVYGGIAKDGYGNTKAGFKVKGIINRFDYDLKWNALTEAGGATVGKDIDMTLNLEFAQDK
ncbi:MAG: YceI family protein [Chitinophagaceae bacterium]